MKKKRLFYIALTIFAVTILTVMISSILPMIIQILSNPLNGSAYARIINGLSKNSITIIYWILILFIFIIFTSGLSFVVYFIISRITSDYNKSHRIALILFRIGIVISLILSLLITLNSELFNLIAAIISCLALYQYIFPRIK